MDSIKIVSKKMPPTRFWCNCDAISKAGKLLFCAYFIRECGLAVSQMFSSSPGDKGAWGILDTVNNFCSDYEIYFNTIGAYGFFIFVVFGLIAKKSRSKNPEAKYPSKYSLANRKLFYWFVLPGTPLLLVSLVSGAFTLMFIVLGLLIIVFAAALAPRELARAERMRDIETAVRRGMN